MQLYMDAAASFWREWIINYDASHQRALGKDAAYRQPAVSLTMLAGGSGASIAPCLRSARRAHRHFTNFPVRWLGGLIAFTALVAALLNLRRLIGGLRDRTLRAHPERAPRESAALWYDTDGGPHGAAGLAQVAVANTAGFRRGHSGSGTAEESGQIYARLRVGAFRQVGGRRPKFAGAFPGYHCRQNGGFQNKPNRAATS